jgi:2-phosphosulfolactate phosphatase
MTNRVKIDCFPESASRYIEGYAIVIVDVVRATTTAITAAAAGRRCYVVPTVAAARAKAGQLHRPLLAGEQGGLVPDGFDCNNSPAEFARRSDTERPVVLLSSSGTPLCHEASRGDAVYLACLRNYAFTALNLAGRFPRVAVIGAGTKGEFREEDQLCCAWIAEGLMACGYDAEDDFTAKVVTRWSQARADAWLCGNSAGYLRRSGQLDDLEFILAHINDLKSTFALRDGEVIAETRAGSAPAHGRVPESALIPV